MWYVIGAVIVGAALIFLMNGTFPSLFANVGETFEDKVEQSTEMTDGIRPPIRQDNRVKESDVYYTQSQLKEYDAKTNTWTLNVNPTPAGSTWHEFGGLSIETKRFVVPYGGQVTFSYDIYVPQSVTNTNDLNSYPADDSVARWNGNDSHVVPAGHNRSRTLVPGEWQRVSFTYSNTHEKNVNHISIYEASRIGVVNPTTKGLEVKIRDIRIDIEE